MLDDVLFVVAALTRGDRIYAELVQVYGVVLPDAESPRGPFTVSDDEIDALLLPDLRQELLHDPHAGLPDDLTDEEDTQRCHQERIAAAALLDKLSVILLRFEARPDGEIW